MKEKYKRKREAAQRAQHPDLSAPNTAVPQEQLGTYTPEKATPDKPAKTQDGSKPSMKPVWRKPESPLAWGTFAAAVSVAVIYFLQLQVMQQSTRIDQRPWVKVTSEISPVKEGDVLSANLHVTEFGKTPAKDPVADFVIAKVVNGEAPVFEYALNHERARMGLLYPGDSAGLPFYRIDPFAKDPTIKQPVSSREFDDFQKGKIFFVLYGKVTYTDFFRVEHWTHYCIPFIPPTAATVTHKKCTTYNDIDDNN